jgi:putative flippase GtrA
MRSKAGITPGSGLVRSVFETAPKLSRYTIASSCALALDFCVFFVLVADGFSAWLAGAIGYAMGLTLHFVLSTRFVFDARSTGKPEARLFGEFAASGIVGLALTASVIAVATDLFQLSALAAKLLAAVLSFAAVYVLRREVIFAVETGPATR